MFLQVAKAPRCSAVPGVLKKGPWLKIPGWFSGVEFAALRHAKAICTFKSLMIAAMKMCAFCRLAPGVYADAPSSSRERAQHPSI